MILRLTTIHHLVKQIFSNYIKYSGINTIFDIRMYTDGLALFGGEENGLAQTDFRFKQFIHRSNFFNAPVYGLQYFKVNFNYSKFDSKDEYLNVTTFSNTEIIKKTL